MTVEEPKKPDNTGANQTDLPTQPQPEIPDASHQQDIQSDKRSSDEPKSPIHVKPGSAKDSGNVPYVEITDGNQSLNSDERHNVLESRKEQRKQLTDDKETKQNAGTEISNTQDAKNLICQPASVHCDKGADITESSSQSRSQLGNKGTYAITRDLTDQLPVEKEKTDDIQNIDRKTKGSVKALDINLHGFGEDCHENRGFLAEGTLLQHPIKEDPESHVRIETLPTGNEAYKQPCVQYVKDKGNKLQNPMEGRYESRDIFETGGERSHYVNRESRSNIQPSKIQARRGTDRLMDGNCLKSTSIDRPLNQSGSYFYENIDLFETGRQESPVSNRPRGVVYFEGDEIEWLPDETPPETQLLTTRLAPFEPDSHESWTWPLWIIIRYVQRRSKLLRKKIFKQFYKAPVFYIISTVVIFWSSDILLKGGPDTDIFLSVIIAFIGCILVTIIFDRGQCSKTDEETSCFGLCGKNVRKIHRSICCCRRQPETERHSRYRRVEAEEDTLFKHEIADVSNIDPNDCPQMRMVEQQEVLNPGSPDYPPQIFQVNADVHASGTKINSKNLGAIRKHRGHASLSSSTKSPYAIKSGSSSASFNLSKAVKVDVYVPETVNSSDVYRRDNSSKLKIFPEQPYKLHKNVYAPEALPNPGERGERFARNIKSGSNEFLQKGESKVRLKKFQDLSPEIPENNMDVPIVNMENINEFKCEHYDLGVACACAGLFKNKEWRR